MANPVKNRDELIKSVSSNARATRRVRGERRRPDTKLTREGFHERFELMVSNIAKVIKGKDDVIRLALTAILGQGHILFEDLPGTGKTMLARAIAQTINAEQSRVQCTPDLLPADITGSAILERKTGDFVFRPGPVFSNIFLADEINRATPKTQSALLEAMQERRVTYDGVVHALPDPFVVLATQNPVEQAGTFPLPEAQLDRFMFKLSLGFLSRDGETEVLRVNQHKEAIESLEPIVDTPEVIEMIDWAEWVSVSEPVLHYIVDLVQATRSDPALQDGASARASLALLRSSRVLAASQGRDDVLPDDVKVLAKPVLTHRLLLTADAVLRDETVENVVDRLVTRVKIPVTAARPATEPTDGARAATK